MSTENQEKDKFDFDSVQLELVDTGLQENNDPIEEEEIEKEEEKTETETVEETEETESQENEVEEEGSVIGIVQKTLGYEILDESGKPKVYEDTEDGVAEYTQDVNKVLEEKYKKLAVESLDPEVRNYHNHLALGKSKADYFSNPLLDIQNAKIDKEDIDLAKQVIKTRFIKGGFSEKDANGMILNIEATGEDAIYERAENDLAFLKDLDNKEKKANEDAIRASREEMVKRQEQEWNTIVSTVKSRNIGGIQIPVTEVDSFINYLSVPVKDGKSQHILDMEKEDTSRDLNYAYQRYKKYDLKSIVKLEVGKEKVKKLSEMFKNSQGNRAGGNEPNNVTKFDFDSEIKM